MERVKTKEIKNEDSRLSELYRFFHVYLPRGIFTIIVVLDINK